MLLKSEVINVKRANLSQGENEEIKYNGLIADYRKLNIFHRT